MSVLRALRASACARRSDTPEQVRDLDGGRELQRAVGTITVAIRSFGLPPLPSLQWLSYNELPYRQEVDEAIVRKSLPPAAGAESTAAAGVEGSRWTPGASTRKEVEGGQCGSSARATKKVATGQCGPDPQRPSAALMDAPCPPGDLADEGRATVTKPRVSGGHREEAHERPGPGPFSAISQGADYGQQPSRTAAGAAHRYIPVENATAPLSRLPSCRPRRGRR